MGRQRNRSKWKRRLENAGFVRVQDGKWNIHRGHPGVPFCYAKEILHGCMLLSVDPEEILSMDREKWESGDRDPENYMTIYYRNMTWKDT